MDTSDLIGAVALVIGFITVTSSSVLAWHAIRLNQNANHLSATLELLQPHRTGEFFLKEVTLWQELSEHDPSLGFMNLPDPIRGYAIEIGCYYQSLSYVSEYGIADGEFIAIQTEYRLLRTWECIKLHVEGERRLRGDTDTFLNSYERFAAQIPTLDKAYVEERLTGRGRRRLGSAF